MNKPDKPSAFPPMASSATEAIEQLQHYGIALLPELLAGDELQVAREAVYVGPEEDAREGRSADSFVLDYGEGNVRVWNLLSRGSVFCDMVEHPFAMEILTALIGWPAILGNFSANIAQPGSQGGALHADQLFVPMPWPAEPQGINFAWLLDDFTADNGATEVVLGSHARTDPSEKPAAAPEPLIAPAGTVVAFESRVWHRTGNNRSDHPRAAAFAWYPKPIYRTQENWFLTLDDDVLEGASDTLLTLLGYRTKGLGLVYGGSPR